VAVDAQGGVLVALGHDGVVHPVERLGVVGEVAALALLVVGLGDLAPGAELERAGGVIAGLVRVAVGAAQRLAVDRLGELLLVDEERKLLPAGQVEGLAGVRVAAEAVLLLGRDAGRGGRSRQEDQE